MKRFVFGFIVSLFSVSLLTVPAVQAAVDDTPDNDTVAIIRGGVFSETALRTKAAQGDVPRVFAAFGIQQNELNGFVDGVVWKDGRVTVGQNDVVARGAVTAGRWDNPKPGMTRIPNTDRAYKMSTSNFVDEGQTAFIKMVNGRFSFAVIKPCGNPVTANPVNPPTPGLTVQKDVATMSGGWMQTVSVKPGDHVRFRITAKNTGKTTLDKLSFQDVLPTGLAQVANKGTLNGTPFGNGVGSGFTLPALKPGASHVIVFEAMTNPAENRPAACTTGLVNTGTVRSGGAVHDKSDTAVVKVCAPQVTPSYACESLTYSFVNKEARQVRFAARHTSTTGATFSHYLYTFGDGTEQVRSTDASIEHTYAKDGNFTARVTAVFTVNGQEKSASSESCAVQVSFDTPVTPTPETPAPTKSVPEQLVDTGPGAIFGAFISTITGGVIAYKYVWLRRFV